MSIADLLRSRRVAATGAHLLVSALVAAVCGWLVFQVWYPAPFGALAGGLGLFTLLMAIDVVVGPLLTAVVASPRKPRAELARDLAFIGLLQVAALSYGLHTIAVARPVWLAFEVDRLRVVSAVDIDPALLPEAPPPLRELPWTGPRLIAAVKPTDAAGLLRSIDLGLAGVDLAYLPSQWREFDEARGAAWAATRPVAELLQRYPDVRTPLARIAGVEGVAIETLRFIPVMSRHASVVAVVAGPEFRVLGTLDRDGFF